MKTLKTHLLICCLGSMTLAQSQTDPQLKSDVTNNFLDLQAGTLGDIFGDSLTGGNGKITNYLELVEKSGRPESEKKHLREAYLLYSRSLDAKGKDSLQAVLSKQLLSTKKDSL
ncbi:hypothetical protein [Eudoraea sp.]|uniref:hypothetical protein n=1 Tax=Eudoraea sp. TaxID=1979955 RepID=UPI003C78FE6A